MFRLAFSQTLVCWVTTLLFLIFLVPTNDLFISCKHLAIYIVIIHMSCQIYLLAQAIEVELNRMKNRFLIHNENVHNLFHSSFP